jgi:hypothetical protein
MNPDGSTTLAWLRIAGFVALALVLVADLLTPYKPHFSAYGLRFDTFPWFFPTFGFVSTVGLVIVAKTMGILLLREDTYYAR